MKKIYFVRHAESEGNAGAIRGTHLSKLSEKGKAQADKIAERCAKLPIEAIISSTMIRAVETSEQINRKLSRPVYHSDLFNERRRPSEQLGKPKDDPKALNSEKEIFAHFAEKGYRFSDEENFEDLHSRAKKALVHIEGMKEEHILVVTHGVFMKVILACVLFENSLNGKLCQDILKKFHMENTGITVLCFDPENTTNRWWVWIWNDHAHLG